MYGLQRLLPAALLSAFFMLACGGQGGTPPAPAASAAAAVPISAGPYTLAPGTLTLPVPPAVNQAGNLPPYAGTVTFAVDRGSLTGAVTLSVDASQLPKGVKAQFAQATIPAGSASAALTLQAGYPDPADPTFATQVYPALGTYAIPVTLSTPGSPDTVINLTLALVQEAGAFGVNFCDANQQVTVLTNINLTPGVTTSQGILPYWSRGTASSAGPVTLSTQKVPGLLTVTFDGGSSTAAGNLNVAHVLNLQAQAGLAPGMYAFEVLATFAGTTRALPVVVTCSPAPFSIVAPLSPSVSVAQGQSLSLPMYLWHDDTFFEPDGGANPAYVGGTQLAVTGTLPAGLEVMFMNADPTALASVPLMIQAGPLVPPGSYPVTLQASRVTATTTVAAPPLALNVVVTAASAAPALWVQNVEWGQTVVAPNLALVGGKPALLRVQLFADRPGATAPEVLATVQNAQGALVDTVTLTGPAQVPMAIGEGDLLATLSTFTSILPAADLQPGMQVTIQAGTQGAFASQVLLPSVTAGPMLDLTIVPVVHKGVAPILPPDAGMIRELMAIWPLQGVKLSHRAAYTTSTVLPQPADANNGSGWAQLLSEMAALRLVDGAASNYYGFLNPGITTHFGFATTGISHIGDGVGIGIDQAPEGLFENVNAPLDLATMVMVHEEGHAFNLNHAPAGGAGNPQLNYPYPAAVLGSWGFDPATGKAYAPAAQADIMSYASVPQWISDWDYRNAQTFLEVAGPAASAPNAADGALPCPADQWLVSGWIDPAGQAHLLPLVRVSAVSRPPVPGQFQLLLSTAQGCAPISFSADSVPDLPAGHRQFSFTVPAGAELTCAEVRGQGLHPDRRIGILDLANRAQAVATALQDQSLVVQEAGGILHLAWDAKLHPYVNVIHEGAQRTTLALHLTGGSADLSLDGLAPGGRFSLHFSDGLNPVILSRAR